MSVYVSMSAYVLRFLCSANLSCVMHALHDISPGAGDLRRAVAAAERLATVFGDTHPRERRDAAVLLLHAGNFSQVTLYG